MPDVPVATSHGRLRNSADIVAVLRHGQRRAGALSVTHAQPRDGGGGWPGARIAVVASKKVGPAVARNRAKRLLRVAAREVAWTPGHDVVLVARAATPAATAAAVVDEVRRQATALGVAA